MSHADKEGVRKDLNDMLQYIIDQYVYLDEKKVDIQCIREKYSSAIEGLNSRGDVILFFEYLLNELYDSHISLNTNLSESYRLWAPIYAEISNDQVYIKNVWQTQIQNLNGDIIRAEIINFNGTPFIEKIDDFPSYCNDKSDPEVRRWIANKVIAGKYSEPRMLTLKLKNGSEVEFDLDQLILKSEEGLLSTEVVDEIGIVRINNSLGRNELITSFDAALDDLMDTKGLILDLRNTNSGGNTYVAKGIMSRFIDKELPYQKHSYIESYSGQPKLVRSWLEMVSPRGVQYKKPVVVLVGRWTGSMGEGLAVGFDGMNRAEIVGTEMKRLAGSDFDFQFRNQTFGYKMILQRLDHINGTPREQFVPKHYVQQSTIDKDEVMEKGLALIGGLVER